MDKAVFRDQPWTLEKIDNVLIRLRAASTQVGQGYQIHTAMLDAIALIEWLREDQAP